MAVKNICTKWGKLVAIQLKTRSVKGGAVTAVNKGNENDTASFNWLSGN